MRKNIIFFTAILLLSLAAGSCKRISNKNQNEEVILASFTVLADIIKNVSKDDFIVRSIVKPGVEVHGYQPTPSDLVKASSAFVFVDNGFGFELWAEKFISNLKVKRITVSEGLDPIFISEDSYEGKPNPHAWISPKRGMLYVDIIVESLSELRPSKRELFEENGRIYKDKLSTIDKEFSLFINNLNKEKRYLVSCEGAFSYLTNDYGLEEVYLWPVNAESQITPKRMARTISIVKDKNVQAVFCESTVSNESQMVVVNETGASFGGDLFVDSLSEDSGPASSYIKMLKHNLNLIKKGLL
ncbi:metal ABC transporter substrate-binding protein [Prochlorococcus marinus]|uniref:metal ABC transporter substrate-binding protein n=1 Tax=Prochlorococcus marinus TaxID=1219 RepID=UPI001ADCE7ED|nr:metal ABC transporter substrate-binding protein [Prochlorococcus marinus]MBO8218797.1 metal ABC transporter substrate-binding protein [Prochlorococcus marinus CUG1416]MBW3051201.1 metal ABC transporter substrate-binding protein [Prochlorococcus marinus str. MU1416]